MIAALFVMERGSYSGLAGVDPWPEARDARRYAGTDQVVAHPPCKTWCRMAHLSKDGIGNDGGTFQAALAAVRRCGGVLEHPMGSKAWKAHGLPPPGGEPGWRVGQPGPKDAFGGYTIEVQQCRWGHPALKATWLYIVGTDDLPPIPNPPWRIIRTDCASMGHQARNHTPPAFRDWLLSLARRCVPPAQLERSA